MKNNFQKTSLLVAILFLISVCSAFVFLYDKINDNNQKAEQGTEAWQTESHRRAEITLLNNSLNQISNDRSMLETHFTSSSDIVPFLNTIEQLEPSSLASVEIDSVDTGTNNSALTVGLKASGSFTEVYKFLTLLENSPYELNFLSVDIHKTTPGDMSTTNIKNSAWEAVFKIQLLSFVP
jgi:Tfp pilus assembly protein PilO